MDLGRPGMLNPSHLGLPPRSFTFSGMTDPAKGVSPQGYRGGMLGTAHDYQSDFMLGDINKTPGAGTYRGGGGAAHGITPGGPTAQGGTAQGAGARSWQGEGGVRQGAAAQGAGRGASAPNTAEAQGAPDPPDEAFQTAQQIVGAGQKAIGVAKALMPDTSTGVATGDIMSGEGAPSTSTGATSAKVSAPGPTGTEPVSVATEDILSPEGMAPGTPAINLPTGATPAAGDIAAGGGMPSEFGVAGDVNAYMPGGSGGLGSTAVSANTPTSVLGAAGKVAGAAGAGLSAASAVKSMVEAIQSGDGVKIASAGAQMASAGISSIQEAGQIGLISKETMNEIAPALAAAAPYLAMGGIVLGIAEHNPASVASGIGSTAVAAGVASGAIGGASALVSGGLALLPALAIMAGEGRSAAIDARRARLAKAANAMFQAAPETRNLPKELAALNAGDASQLTAISRSAGLALQIQMVSNGMDTGGQSMATFFRSVSAKIPAQYRGQLYAEVAKQAGWDPRTSAQQNPYTFVADRLGYAPGPPPPGWQAPALPPTTMSGSPMGGAPGPAPDPYAHYRQPGDIVGYNQQTREPITWAESQRRAAQPTSGFIMGQGGGM